MKISKTTTLSLSLKSRPLRRERTVHEALSDLQRAYSVFVPAPDDIFNLFQLILLHPDRPRSPRNTAANLQEVITRLANVSGLDYDGNLVNAFHEQFEKVRYREISRPPAVVTVSEESLHGAGLTIATPVPRAGINASKSRTSQRQVRLSNISSGAYTGGTALKRLIWKHAEPLFLLLMEELETECVSEVGDRSLLGIITKRLISNVGVSRTNQKGASVVLSMENGVNMRGGGAASRMHGEVYDDLHGVSGLHFIVFPVECLGRYQWRVYKGIDVCDSELDESASPEALRRDNFYQAGLWLQGSGRLNDATRDGHKNMRNDASTDSTANTRSTGTPYERRRGDLGHINITGAYRTAPFVKIDARPFLSELAMNRCKLAATYRKKSKNNSDMAFQAICLLRNVLRKGLFESTIRALYDLSGCYLSGLGVEEDENMASVLRYCARGLRRSYGTRARWSKRFATEIGFRFDQEPEQRICVICLLYQRSLVSLDIYGKCIILSLRDADAFTDELSVKPLGVACVTDEAIAWRGEFNLLESDGCLSNQSKKEIERSQNVGLKMMKWLCIWIFERNMNMKQIRREMNVEQIRREMNVEQIRREMNVEQIRREMNVEQIRREMTDETLFSQKAFSELETLVSERRCCTRVVMCSAVFLLVLLLYEAWIVSLLVEKSYFNSV